MLKFHLQFHDGLTVACVKTVKFISGAFFGRQVSLFNKTIQYMHLHDFVLFLFFAIQIDSSRITVMAEDLWEQLKTARQNAKGKYLPIYCGHISEL